MQYGFYFDQNRCTGCFTCVIACQDWHDVPAGPASWLRIKTVEKGKYPDLFVAFLAMTCYHCHEPACVTACPVGAITKNETNGIVTVDEQTCLGKDCKLCLKSCPYDAPQFGLESNAKMQKCDLCLDRWSNGKKPVCVDSCPTFALDAGPLDELKAKYSSVRDAEGFVYFENILPSVIFRPKADVKRLITQRISITPNKE